ncbi:hypothetical protein Tco_0039322 [Tanacetum coccineum]
MAAVNDVLQLVDKNGGSYTAIAPKLEPRKFNKWKKRMLCYLARMKPYYLKCIKDDPFQPKTAEGDAKPESQWTPDERRVVVQDQRLKSIIMSCLTDDIMESVISCVSSKETWTDLIHSFEGPSDTKENRIMDLKLEYQTFRAKSSESHSQTYTRYKTLLNELANDGVNLSKNEINVGFVNSLPEKWLTFSQGLRNSNHTQTLDLADIYRRFVYEDNLIQRRYSDKKRLLLLFSQALQFYCFFSNNVIQEFQENSDDKSSSNSSSQADPKFQKDYKAGYKKMKAKLALLEASPSSSQNPKTFQPKNKGLVAETFDWDEEDVYDDEEVTQVKVLMALADDELTVEKSHAINGEWVDITIRKVNTLLSIDEDADWQNYLKYINIDLKFVKEQRLNLLSKYNKIVFEFNKCRDELLVLKQAKLDAVTFQIQNTKLTNKLPNFNTGRILVPESQAVNESLKPTKNTPKSSKDSEAESLTHLPPLENLQGALPSSENAGSSKSLRPKPIQKPQLKCELCHYTNHLTDDCYRILYCMIFKREDHRTFDHKMYTDSLKRSENYKAQPYQYAYPSKQILKAKVKPFPPCTHYGFNDHRPSDCRNYPECGICGSYDYFTSRHNRVIHIKGGVLVVSSQSSESSIGVKCNTCGSTIHSTTNHNDFDHFKKGEKIQATKDREPTKKLSEYNTRRQQIEENYHVTFDESMEAIRFTNTSVDEIGIDDSSRYPPDEFLHEDDPSRQYKLDYDISYYVIPHRRSLTELTQENHVPGVIVPNEPGIYITEDTEGHPDLINTEGTQEQNVQNDQITTQPTDVPSGNNTKVSGSITESLVPDVTQSPILNQASTSMLTRSMAAKLTTASTSECLFVDFLSKIETKDIRGTKASRMD